MFINFLILYFFPLLSLKQNLGFTFISDYIPLQVLFFVLICNNTCMHGSMKQRLIKSTFPRKVLTILYKNHLKKEK